MAWLRLLAFKKFNNPKEFIILSILQTKLYYYYYLFIIFKEMNMQSFSKQTNMNKYFGSAVSFSEKMTGENSTCEHSLMQNHQHLTYTFGYPIIDESALSQNSIKAPKKLERRSQIIDSQYSQAMKCQAFQQTKTSFQGLQMILKNQNINLKQQNQMLLHEIHRLKTGNKKIKDSCFTKRIELQEKKRGDDIMNTMMTRLVMLQQKFKKKNLDQSQCSLLDILNQAEAHFN